MTLLLNTEGEKEVKNRVLVRTYANASTKGLQVIIKIVFLNSDLKFSSIRASEGFSKYEKPECC